LAAEPVIYFLLGLILGVAVALLQMTFELVLTSVDYIEIIVSKFAPLLFDLTLHLLPVSFDAVPIHY